MKKLDSFVRSAQKGDKDAFGVLVRHYQNMAYGVSYARIDDADLAQDVAQEAFVDAYLSLDKLREPAAFSSWFYRILVKHADRVLRSRRVMVSPDVLLGMPSDEPSPFWVTEMREVQQAVSELPEGQRLAVVLYHLEGYAQKEVAEFLGLPVSTVKKRLFDARKRLKERMTMAQDTVQDVSKDGGFARKVAFFTALKTGDLDTVGKLIEEDGDLICAETEWNTPIPDRAHWPGGLLPISWAARAGDEKLLTLLLDKGADIETKTKMDETPLHHAVLSARLNTAKLLVERGANVGALAGFGQTVLHRAVLRGDANMVGFLVASGVDVDAKDNKGYAAVDWAALKGHLDLVTQLVNAGAQEPTVKVADAQPLASRPKKRKVPGGQAVLGRILDHAGKTKDGLGDLVANLAVESTLTDGRSALLETGIKGIDLFAPFKRGGYIGFEPGIGMGRTVLLAQVARNVIVHHGGQVVCLGLDDDFHSAQGMVDELRDGHGGDGKVLNEHVVHVFGHVSDSVSKRHQLVETGLAVAERFRQEGHEVLLTVEGDLAKTEGVVSFLNSHVAITPDAAITTLFIGQQTSGVDAFGELDAVVAFSPEMAQQGLYPSIDAAHSRSVLLNTQEFSSEHNQTVQEVRDLLYQYFRRNLHGAYQKYGMNCIVVDDGGQTEATILRARRLAHFLSQPFHGTEIWYAVPGQTVALEETVKGCREILDGKYDDVPERAFLMVGTVEMALEKAKTLRG